MDMYARDFYSDVKAKKCNIYRNFKSKKKFKMYFEKLPSKERKKYMEEQNYKEMNINTITWNEAKKLNEETKTFLLNTLIEKYGNNDSAIERNTALTKFNIATLRKQCGFKSGEGKRSNRIGRRIIEKNLINDNVVVSLPISSAEVEYADPPGQEPIQESDSIKQDEFKVECNPLKDMLSAHLELEGTYFKEVLSLNLDCDGETARPKIEALMIFLDLHREYNIEIKIFEKR